jgi:hypothetical protein
MEKLAELPRYVACGRVTKRPIFEFLSPAIHPGDALSVFPLPDDYSFGILQSLTHWNWFTERCSTLREDYRYTSTTVFDTFPWPQAPNQKVVIAVSKAARELRDEAQEALDTAVRNAYGMKATTDPLKFLFELNQSIATAENERNPVVPPGLPSHCAKLAEAFSTDCLAPKSALSNT